MTILHSQRVKKLVIGAPAGGRHSFCPVEIHYFDGSHEKTAMQIWRIMTVIEAMERDAAPLLRAGGSLTDA